MAEWIDFLFGVESQETLCCSHPHGNVKGLMQPLPNYFSRLLIYLVPFLPTESFSCFLLEWLHFTVARAALIIHVPVKQTKLADNHLALWSVDNQRLLLFVNVARLLWPWKTLNNYFVRFLDVRISFWKFWDWTICLYRIWLGSCAMFAKVSNELRRCKFWRPLFNAVACPTTTVTGHLKP